MPFHVGIAATGGGAASVLDNMNAAVNQQAQQTATQQRQQQIDDMENSRAQFQALQDGWQKADVVTQDPSGLKRRGTVAGIDPNRIQTVGGTRMYKPTDLETGKTYVPPPGSLMYNLHMANGWDGKTPINPAQSHELAMAVNEATPKDEASHIDVSGKFLDGEGNPVPVMIGDKTGTVRPLKLNGGAANTPGAANGGAFDTSQPPAQAQPTSGPDPNRPTIRNLDTSQDVPEPQITAAPPQATDPQGRPFWGQNQPGAQPAQPAQPAAAPPAAPAGGAPSAFAQPQTEGKRPGRTASGAAHQRRIAERRVHVRADLED